MTPQMRRKTSCGSKRQLHFDGRVHGCGNQHDQFGESGCRVVEPQGSILLVYFVADESGSMGRNIDELNAGLSSLHDSLQRESFAAARVRLSVIGFSDTAFTYLEPADLRVLQGMPVLTAQSLTSFAAAFDQLTYRIRVDIPSLKAQGY